MAPELFKIGAAASIDLAALDVWSLGVTLYYMVVHMPALRGVYTSATSALWWGIQPVSAGVFGVPAGIVAVVVLSLLSRKGNNRAPSE